MYLQKKTVKATKSSQNIYKNLKGDIYFASLTNNNITLIMIISNLIIFRHETCRLPVEYWTTTLPLVIQSLLIASYLWPCQAKLNKYFRSSTFVAL